MKIKTYDQQRKHFADHSASAILMDGEHVASITIKYPKDGAGRLYAYVHWLGTEMQRGHANGGGYDKASAAISVAARQYLIDFDKSLPSDVDSFNANARKPHLAQCMFWEYLKKDDGESWESALRSAGFTVCRII